MSIDRTEKNIEQDKLIHEGLTEQVIGAAMEVHKALGPGLLESIYEECLCHELRLRELKFQRQLSVPVIYKGVSLDCGYRLDLIVEDIVILELKCIERVLAIHEAQLLTYLKLMDKPVGFIINFNVPVLRQGIIRKVFDSASPRLRGEKSFVAGAGSNDGR
ncbi:MAG TPA: GxxExxY protein [Candidatus Angelobacter sp.]|nr:GxxExxY protein [Candidatus Angelobacter sp.]